MHEEAFRVLGREDGDIVSGFDTEIEIEIEIEIARRSNVRLKPTMDLSQLSPFSPSFCLQNLTKPSATATV